MVITPTSQIDGHAHQQPAIAEGPANDDPDEPPPSGSSFQESSPSTLSDNQNESVNLRSKGISDVATPTNAKVWNGEPGTAHGFSGETVAAVLGVKDSFGLSTDESENRRERDGPNKLTGAGQVSAVKVLIRQVSNSLTIVGLTRRLGMNSN